MKQIYLIAFFALFSLSLSANVHPRFLKEIELMKAGAQNRDFDLCTELHAHIANLQINAETYNGQDQEFPNTQNSIGLTFYYEVTWKKLEDIAMAKGQPPRVFGDDISAADIKQGDVGDCYFLSALSGFANYNPEYLRSLFDEQTQIEKEKGIYTTNWLINGQKVKVSVDSWIPIYVNTGEPVFANFKNDFEFWPIILEKAWAKIYGSYGNIEAGCTSQAYRSLANAPPFSYTHSSTTVEQLWDILKTQIANHMPLSTNTRITNLYNLPKSHAYTPLGTCEHEYENGTYLRLVKMSNPWGLEVYSGPFNDNDPEWTTELREKCGSIPGNDGQFFMPINIYRLVLVETAGVKLQTGFTSHILPSDELPNDNIEYEDSYEITVAPGEETNTIYIGVDFLDSRFNQMLPESCAMKGDFFSSYIMSEDFSFMRQIFDDSASSNYHAEVTGQSKYLIFVKRRIQTSVMKNYVISVYAPDQSVTITKSNIVRTDLFLQNLVNNKEKGVSYSLKPDVNLIAKVPITSNTYSTGIILDNKSLANILDMHIVFYTRHFNIISDFCQIDNSKKYIFLNFQFIDKAYISTYYSKYVCLTKAYPKQIKPILIQHTNEFGSTYIKCYYKYSVE